MIHRSRGEFSIISFCHHWIFFLCHILWAVTKWHEESLCQSQPRRVSKSSEQRIIQTTSERIGNGQKKFQPQFQKLLQCAISYTPRLDNISIIIFNLVLTWVSLIWLLRNEIVSGAPWWLADWMFSRWRSLDMVMIFLRLLYLCDLLVNCYSFYQNYLSIHNNRV